MDYPACATEPQSEDGQSWEQEPEGWTPDVGANAVVGEISRRELPRAALERGLQRRS